MKTLKDRINEGFFQNVETIKEWKDRTQYDIGEYVHVKIDGWFDSVLKVKEYRFIYNPYDYLSNCGCESCGLKQACIKGNIKNPKCMKKDRSDHKDIIYERVK